MKLSPFLSWCAAQGIQSNIQICSQPADSASGTYRYVTWREESEKEAAEPILPFVNNNDDSNNDGRSLIRFRASACLTGTSSTDLAENLLNEASQKESSRFASYIQLLPKLADFQTMPRFWPKEQVELVSKYDGGLLKQALESDETRIKSFVEKKNNFDDAETLQWALACADSRSNYLPSPENPNEYIFAMTPILDMINHDGSVSTKMKTIERSKENGESEYILQIEDKDGKPGKSIDRAGSKSSNPRNDGISFWDRLFSGGNEAAEYNEMKEVCISYGPLTNLATLCNYGFVSATDTDDIDGDTANPCNLEPVTVRLIGKPPVTIVIQSDGSIRRSALGSDDGLSKLREYLMTDQERRELEDSLDSPSFSTLSIVSSRNEEEVFALIGGELEEAIYLAKMGLRALDEDTDAATKPFYRPARNYLAGRFETLSRGVARIGKEYPDLFWDGGQ